jgi:Zn finger protein HypA/HybF involved in hydrogenase expression
MPKTKKVNYGKMFQEIKGYGAKKIRPERIYICPRCSSTDTKVNEGGQFVCNGCFLVMKVK